MQRSALFLLVPLVIVGCQRSELRGKSVPSPDGKTYLVVADDNGGQCGPLFVDDIEWKFRVNEAGEITPGVHTIRCGPDGGGDIHFDVKPGTTFHFDYWGP